MRLIALTVTLLALSTNAYADSLTLAISPAKVPMGTALTYTVSGSATEYNAVVVRDVHRSEEPCVDRTGAEHAESTVLYEGPVSGSFAISKPITINNYGPEGEYRVCAYLFGGESQVVEHYPEPCRELKSPPAFCWEGEQAEARFTVETPAGPTPSPTPLVVPLLTPTVSVPIVPAPSPQPLVAPVSKRKLPLCRGKSQRKHPKCRTRKRSRHVIRSHSHHKRRTA